jgi:glycerol-3-phosphate acyltransferase PlsX
VTDAGVRRPVTVALDLLGGDGAPAAVVAGALRATAADPAVRCVLVGPPEVAADQLATRGASGALDVVPAGSAVAVDEDPVRAVRARRDVTVRVAAGLVRAGQADATVSVGPTGAAVAAAQFTLGRLPGVTRPALAVVIPARHDPLVLLDVGAGIEATAGQLAQFALAGAAYARAHLGLTDPRIGLLSVATEPGKGDPLRREAQALFAELPVRFVGNVEGHDVAVGGPADVVVTDGFTGNVLLKGLEGAFRLLVAAGARPPDALDPERLGGGVLLGVDGVSVVGHSRASAQAVSACVAVAATAVRADLVPRAAAALADLVARRRQSAGLAPAGVGR